MNNPTHDHYATTEIDPGCSMCLMAQTFAPVEVDNAHRAPGDPGGARMTPEYGSNPAIGVMLHDATGALVRGVFVGGCVSRGVGSSFRAAAHTAPDDDHPGWICVRSPKRVLTPAGRPSRLLLHEAAHVLAPRAGHGTKAFIAALAAVGIRTDSYSRAGRTRGRKVYVHGHLKGEPCGVGCMTYGEWIKALDR
jgi:hypothetical protein